MMSRWRKFTKRLGGAAKAIASVQPIVLAARVKPKNVLRGVKAATNLQEAAVRRTLRGDFKGATQVGISKSAKAIRANVQAFLPGTAIERKITAVEQELKSSDPAVVARAQRRSAQIDRIAVGSGLAVLSAATAGSATGAFLSAFQSVAGAVKQERAIKLAQREDDKLLAEEEAEIKALERQLLDRQMGFEHRKYEPNLLDAARDTYAGEAA